MITFKQADKIFSYEPILGAITNKVVRNYAVKGKHAGSKDRNSWFATVSGFKYRLIDIVFLLYTGEHPQQKLYFKDGNLSNFEWANITTEKPVSRPYNIKKLTLGRYPLIKSETGYAIIISQNAINCLVQSIKYFRSGLAHVKLDELNKRVQVDTEKLFAHYELDGFVRVHP